MAYPTGVSFQHTGLAMGLQPIGETSSTQNHVLGLVTEAKDVTYGPGRFVYCKGVASTAAGDVCSYDTANGDTARVVSAGGTSTGPVGVAMSANVASRFGWYQIEGAGPVATTSVSADDRLYMTATAGTLDNAVVASDLVTGIVARSATVAGFATCQIDHPSVNSLGGSSGSNSGDVTLAAVGSTPAAAGASLSAQVLTLQPADGSQPGVVTTAAQTFAGIKTFSSVPVFSGGIGALGCTNVLKITLTAEAEAANTIEVEGQVEDLSGLDAATAREVMVRSLAVSDAQGTITIGAGANPGTLIKAHNPATGAKVGWITTTTAGHFRFIITNTVAETNVVEVTANSAIVAVLKLTFA